LSIQRIGSRPAGVRPFLHLLVLALAGLLLVSLVGCGTASRVVARGTPEPVNVREQEHHIATDKWDKATHSGGPWTPKFRRIFKKAGMSLNDLANKVRVRAHKGPHSQEYHAAVLEALNDATRSCSSIQQCRVALTRALEKLAREITTPGTKLNKLVTRVQ
jgi:hypothetical protein